MFRKLVLLLMILQLPCYLNLHAAIKKTSTDTLRIHPIGDSITRGKEGDNYRHYLRTRLKNEMHVEVDFVGSCPHGPDSGADWLDYQAAMDSLENDIEHDGWGGFKIHEIIANTKATPPFTIEGLVTKYPSDFILLMIGTNDIYFSWEIDKAPAKVDTLVRKILTNSSANLIVASIPPTYLASINARIDAYNAQVKSIVDSYRAQGNKIEYIDVNSTMTVADLCSDVVHPNSSGFKKIADGYFDAINEVLTGIEVDEKKSEIPSTIELYQNYPNPFNSDTTIRFSLADQSFVTLKIYDVLGKEIKTCISEERSAGDFIYNFDAGDLTSGMYFYRVNAGNSSATRRLLLLK